MNGALLFYLIACHYAADFPLQGDYLARAKNHRLPSAPGDMDWWQALLAHSVIHGGLVLLLTGSMFCGIAEVLIHAATDWMKCDRRISFRTDQAIHIACKVLWTLLFSYSVHIPWAGL